MKLFSKKETNVYTFILGKDQLLYEVIRQYAFSISTKDVDAREVYSNDKLTTITIKTHVLMPGIKYNLDKYNLKYHVAGNTIIIETGLGSN